MQPVHADPDQPVPGRQRLRRLGDPPAELARQLGYHDIGAGQRDPAVGGQAVVGDHLMPLARVGVADPQCRHRRPAEHRRRVHRLARGHPGEPPPRTGPEVARPLGNHDQIGPEHMPRRQQAGVHGDGLQISAERLARGDGPGQPARFAQPGHGPGEPGRQRAAVQHHVRGPARRLRSALADGEPGAAGLAVEAFRVKTREHRGHGRVQVRDHHRDAVQIIGVAQHVVMGRALLVGAEHAGLQRRVPRLDQVPGLF